MPANGDFSIGHEILMASESENNCSKIENYSPITNNNNNTTNNSSEKLLNSSDKMAINENGRYISHPQRHLHEKFLRECIEVILNSAVFDGTDRQNKVTNWCDPEKLEATFKFQLKNQPETDVELLNLIKDTIKFSVKTGHPYFINQLYSSLDPYALVGQWLTDALNPSVYTYEVSPVFICMEETVLAEMRRIVGFPNNGDGDGIFCPGGSIANGYAISCARYKAQPDIKAKGLSSCERLVLFTSEDSHYSIQKLSSFMGIGSDNVYKVETDNLGKLKVQSLESQIERALSEGAKPFMVSATAGTTVLGAFDSLEEIADICERYNLWMHVDAAWGGGALISQKYRHLLKGIERADSVTWNPHKLLSSAQQCSTFLTRHKGILSECHSTNATYLFQKDKFYDTKYDTGDKHIQCGRRADVLKFWFMWKAKGTDGLEQHINKVFQMAEYFTNQLKNCKDFELVLASPQCTNISFWYIPPSLQNHPKDEEYIRKLQCVAPKIKERMMKTGSMMMTYQPLRSLPNFFRLVIQNSALNFDDMDYFIKTIRTLGSDL